MLQPLGVLINAFFSLHNPFLIERLLKSLLQPFTCCKSKLVIFTTFALSLKRRKHRFFRSRKKRTSLSNKNSIIDSLRNIREYFIHFLHRFKPVFECNFLPVLLIHIPLIGNTHQGIVCFKHGFVREKNFICRYQRNIVFVSKINKCFFSIPLRGNAMSKQLHIKTIFKDIQQILC